MRTQPLSAPEHEVHVLRDIMVPMRDGVRLCTDLYFPARGGQPLPGRHPALLCRTPYSKVETEAGMGYGHWFAQRGYVGVIQDCRGCYGSEGDVDFIRPEAEDGFDTLAWIARQPWTDGQVGTWGTSWCGWTQTGPAALGAPNIAAMVPNMSGAIGRESSVRQGGALELRFLAWAFWHAAGNPQKKLKADPAVDAALNFDSPTFTDWLTRLPIRKGMTQLALVPPYEQWALRLCREGDNTDWWRSPSLAPALYHDRWPDVPILVVGGWYDSYTRSTFRHYEGLRALGRDRVKVLVGPWTHGSGTVEQPHAGDVQFSNDAALDSFRDLHLAWFDAALRHKPTGVDQIPPVRIYVMGGGGGHRSGSGRLFHGGRWRDEQEWPLARTRSTPYYLHGDGSLSPEKPADHTAERGGATTYRFDPANPVPSIGGSVSSLVELGPMPRGLTDPALAPRGARMRDIMAPGGYNQVEAPQFWGCRPPYLPLGSRPDVLVFQTAPLERDLEVTGPVEVHLWVASSARDTDFTSKLVDVYPPSPWYPSGYALNLTDSILRLRYRSGGDAAEPYTPGEVVEITVTLYPTSNLFAAGHRLRLDVSSSNFPRFDVNPNTGDPLGTERRRSGADNTIFHQAQR
ncbi:MAG: CocE/NonD family hydrolase, partial [Gemmatimonadota bacterium]